MNWRTIAHRGAPQKYKENTLPSFAEAINNGARYIELDVHLTTDNVLLVHHDATIVSPAGKLNIDRSCQEDIAQLNLPFVVPTLKEILSLCALHYTTCYVEVKTTKPTAVELVLNIAAETKSSIILSSFHHCHLERSKQLNTDVPTMALLDWEQSVPYNLISKGCVNEIGVGDNLLADIKRKDAQAVGLPTFMYTINDPQRMEKLKATGFAGVFTDTF